MLEYWKKENRLISYSVTMLLFAIAIDNTPELQSIWNSIPYFDVINNSLLLKILFEKYDASHMEVMKQISVIQRLSWKFPKENYEQQGTFYDKLFHGCI